MESIVELVFGITDRRLAGEKMPLAEIRLGNRREQMNNAVIEAEANGFPTMPSVGVVGPRKHFL